MHWSRITIFYLLCSMDTEQGNLLGMASYAYVKENPETHNDPTGHGDPWLIYIVASYESFHQGQTILSDTPGSHALPSPGTRHEPDKLEEHPHDLQSNS